jgi:hypothetical protein
MGAAMPVAKDLVQVDDATSTIVVPHWGITLRTLFGAAVEAWPDAKPGECRAYSVYLKGKCIGIINVQQTTHSKE